jgi:hypothetical protein
LDPQGNISGRPTAAGTYTFQVTVKDSSGQTFTRTCTIRVTEQPGISIGNTHIGFTTHPGTINTGYSGTITATGGRGPYTVERASGQLPPGLKLNSEGKLTGTPRANGTFIFELRITDTATRLSVSVAVALTIGRGFNMMAAIATVRLNEPYSSAIVVTGGKAPYDFRLAGRDLLPEGLKLNREDGTIAGSPTKQGEFTFDVTVIDADGVTATIPCRLTIERR